MKKRIRKIATYLLIGSVSLAGNVYSSQAARAPFATIENRLLLTSESSMYKNTVVAQVKSYVNIRSEASVSGAVVGKLYNNAAATIVDQAGDWYKVKSGDVTGYVKSDYVVSGKKVVQLAKTVASKYATVKATSLNIRKGPSLSSSVQTMVPEGKVLKVKKQSANWVKVSVGGKTGYVSAKYVKISTKFKKAVPVNEEKSNVSVAKLSTTTTELSSAYTFRKQVVEYAKQFNGNPYLWGGTSLTNGADCSGFTQSVFKDNGISIPRTSRTQATSGKVISIKEVQPGDLIFYASSGRINHVALYIGSGKVISASSARSGIRITNYNYRSPYKVVSYIK